jgi:hypothetical protein
VTTDGMARFVAAFVTQCHRTTTHCHDNFGYYSPKSLIPRTLIASPSGIGSAIKSKLVYT